MQNTCFCRTFRNGAAINGKKLELPEASSQKLGVFGLWGTSRNWTNCWFQPNDLMTSQSSLRDWLTASHTKSQDTNFKFTQWRTQKVQQLRFHWSCRPGVFIEFFALHKEFVWELLNNEKLKASETTRALVNLQRCERLLPCTFCLLFT